MANVIKHKRGSGSDPGASDLVVGEVAIRTDVGKLFTKMDNGSVAEIAGGGSDIAINTLSSSSATGGGSATFNGSAYRFTLSQPPSVSAQQLLVSINGVIQKPVAGTGQPSEGFSVNGTDIILGDAPATGADFFILTFKSLGVSEPADNSVTSAKIADGAIVNADINASAAIAGSKIDPSFTSDITITDVNPALLLVDSNNNSDYELGNQDGTFRLRDSTNTTNRMTLSSTGQFDFEGNVDCNAGIDVTGAITGTGDLTIDTNTLFVNASTNRVGIGTTSPTENLMVVDTHANQPQIRIETSDGGNKRLDLFVDSNSVANISAQQSAQNMNIKVRNQTIFTRGSTAAELESMRIDSSGRVLVRGQAAFTSTSLDHRLQVKCQNTGDGIAIIGRNGDHSSALTFTQLDASTLTGSLSASATQFRVRSESALLFQTNGANERMRINSSGNLLVGTTSDSIYNDTSGGGFNIKAGGQLVIAKAASSSADPLVWLNDTGQTTNKSIVFAQDGSEKANIGLAGNDATITVAGSERMRIDSDGNVGIGTTSPSDDLEIASNHSQLRLTDTDDSKFVQFSYSGGKLITRNNSTSTTTAQFTLDESGRLGIGTISPAQKLVVSGTGSQYVAVTSTDSDNTGVLFGDSDIDAGFVLYANSDDSLRFGAGAGNERMRIDSVGRVGIGTTSPTSFNSYANNLVVATSSNTGLTLSGNDASTNYSGLHYAAGTTVRGYLDQQLTSTGRMSLMNMANGYMNFGTNNTERLRILAGGGLTFNGDTATANALDDYEEGTFTPSYPSGSGGSNMLNNAVYSNTQGYYTKIGGCVTFSLRIQCSSHTVIGGHVKINGLPYANGANNGKEGGAFFNYSAAIDTSNSGNRPTMHISNNATSLAFYTSSGQAYNAGAGGSNWNLTLHITGVYHTF